MQISISNCQEEGFAFHLISKLSAIYKHWHAVRNKVSFYSEIGGLGVIRDK
jgi:hypothetical protein